jgi:threonine dehydrogenase-like Zn-dependent dehydrogenase
VPLDVSNDLLRRQVTLIGSWTFSTIGQAQCARFIADRGINVDHLFTHHWRIDEADRPIACSIRKPPARASFHPS